MNDVALGPCPICKKPLCLVPATTALTACAECGRRFLDDESQRRAIRLATENEAWIEKIFWKESTNDFLALLVFAFVDFPFSALLWAGWLVTIALVAWAHWWYAPLAYVAALLGFWLLKKGTRKVFRNQIVSTIQFLVFSRGLILVDGYKEPFFLPWSSIVEYLWSSQVETLTSQIRLDYRTASGTVASVTLHGEEIRQPLGELVDILNARLQRGEAAKK